MRGLVVIKDLGRDPLEWRHIPDVLGSVEYRCVVVVHAGEKLKPGEGKTCAICDNISGSSAADDPLNIGEALGLSGSQV